MDHKSRSFLLLQNNRLHRFLSSHLSLLFLLRVTLDAPRCFLGGDFWRLVENAGSATRVSPLPENPGNARSAMKAMHFFTIGRLSDISAFCCTSMQYRHLLHYASRQLLRRYFELSLLISFDITKPYQNTCFRGSHITLVGHGLAPFALIVG